MAETYGFDVKSQVRGVQSGLSNGRGVRRLEILQSVYRFICKHKLPLGASVFLLAEVVSVALSHFKSSSRVYTLIVALLSLLMVTVTLMTVSRGQPSTGSGSRVITQLEVVFSVLQFLIATYELVMVYRQKHTNHYKFYEIDWILLVAFPLYVFIYWTCNRCQSNNSG